MCQSYTNNTGYDVVVRILGCSSLQYNIPRSFCLVLLLWNLLHMVLSFFPLRHNFSEKDIQVPQYEHATKVSGKSKTRALRSRVANRICKDYLFSLKNSLSCQELNLGPFEYQANLQPTELSGLG